jgi:hypothetical protein
MANGPDLESDAAFCVACQGRNKNTVGRSQKSVQRVRHLGLDETTRIGGTAL